MWITIIIISACMGVGLFYEFGTNKIDDPIEQLAESVLDSKGIEIDFSKDKKEKEKDG